MIEKIVALTAKYISLLWLLLLPIQASLITVLLLVIGDMIVGVWASVKEGYKINSRSLRRTVSKLVVYQISIIATFFIETHLLDYPVTKVMTGLIGVVEGKSFFENLYRITKVDFLKILIDKFQLIYSTLAPASSKDEVQTYKGKNRNDKKEE